MPGVGVSSGGGTESSAFGSWDEGITEPYYPVRLELDTRPKVRPHDPAYNRALAGDDQIRPTFASAGTSVYDPTKVFDPGESFRTAAAPDEEDDDEEDDGADDDEAEDDAEGDDDEDE